MVHLAMVCRATLVVLLFALCVAPVAWAHAKLERAEPGPGEVMPSAPTTVKLWFTQELKTQGSTAEVVNAQGQRVDLGDAKVDLFDPDRKLLVVSLRPNLPHGTYTVRWTSVSAEDGDTERGEFQFHVGQPPAALPAAAPVRPTPTLHIEAPREGTTLAGDAVEIVARLDGGALAELGHLHVYVDGRYVMQADVERFVVHGLGEGEHTIRIELAGHDHHAWQPPVEAAVRIRIVGRAAGGVPAASHSEHAGEAGGSHTHASAPAATSHLPRTGGPPWGLALPLGLALAAAGLALRQRGR